MARERRAKTKASVTTPTKPTQTAEVKDATKGGRVKHNALRKKLYKKAKRAQQVEALQAAIKAAETPASKKELASLRGQVYRQWQPRKNDTEKVAQLERLVKQQEEEIQELRKTLKTGTVPKLEPVSPASEKTGDREPDSSPVKIEQQLMNEISQSSNAGGDEEESTVVEIEEVVETTVEDGKLDKMEGVEETTVANLEDVKYPALPSVEGEDLAAGLAAEVAEEVQQTVNEDSAAKMVEAAAPENQGTPSKPKAEVRDSSADSNAGTPRNIRRSPRKRTVKRRSFAGHSYA